MENKNKPKILIVEDEKGVIESYKEILGDNYEYVVTGSKDEAISILENGLEPYRIILDYIIEGGTGLEVLKYIKSQDNLKDIKVVMVSASDVIDPGTGKTINLEETVKSMGAEYINKPFDVIEIENFVA